MALTDKLTNIANAIRTKTGKSGKLTLDQMVTEINDISGAGFEWGGTNPKLVATYDESWTLADTSFEKNSSASTTATSIKATVSNRFTSSTIAIGDKDIVIVQRCSTTPTHSSSASKNAYLEKGVILYVTHMTKRKTTDTSANTTRQATTMTASMLKYYNTSGTLTRGSASYGFYMTPQTPSCASATSANTTVRVSSPVLYYRASSSYESTTNIKLVTECDFKWHVDVYLVDSASTMGRTIQNTIDNILTGKEN